MTDLPSSDQKFLQAILEHNAAGLRQIYDLFEPRIHALIRKHGGQESDAEDIFQDAIMILYDKARQPGFQLTSSFYSLLYGICYRLWSNQLKKSSRKEVTLPQDTTFIQDNDMEALMEANERHKLFARAMQRLGDECRQLLELFFQGLSMKDIQQAMNFSSEAYVKKRKFHCKEKLVAHAKADPAFAELVKTD